MSFFPKPVKNVFLYHFTFSKLSFFLRIEQAVFTPLSLRLNNVKCAVLHSKKQSVLKRTLYLPYKRAELTHTVR